MGLVNVIGEIGAEPARLTPIEFLVDTGSLYTFVSPDFAAELGVEFSASTTIITANNARSVVPLAFAYLRVLDRENVIIMGSMDVPMPILGALSLQILGLKVDPVNERLEHSRPFGDIPAFGVPLAAS